MPNIKKMVPMLVPLILMFYFMYPQALSIGSSSFVALAGLVGLAVYAYHRFPFKEIFTAFFGLALLFFFEFTIAWINNTGFSEPIGYARTQIAWFFTAYLVLLAIFSIHKKPTFNTFLLYIVASITLQSIIAFFMYINDDVQQFFFSLQMQIEYTEDIVAEVESQRLLGYGIGFFGAGAICGIGLIAASYLFMRMKFELKGFILLVACYVFMFYIGLFMARTTVVGMAIGILLIAFLYWKDNRSEKRQVKPLIIISILLMIGGYIFAMFYFSTFSDWAFELFTNFIETGSLQTKSSNGLEEMFVLPKDPHIILFGTGNIGFWGNDVGYTRLFYYLGIPGTIIFFLYQVFIIHLSKTKDWAVNSFAITIFIYTLALNIKGLIDLNYILYSVFLYFLFYKYYIYYPMIYQNTSKQLPKFKAKI